MADSTKSSSLLSSLAVYVEQRMLGVFVLGIMQGFPWVLIGSSLSLWLREDGLSRGAVGLFGLVFAVYSINFLWAPLLDRIRIPWLSDYVGVRQAWVLVMQAIIFAAMVAFYFMDPQVTLFFMAVLALTVAISSATQDIALDALRIDIIGVTESEKMAIAASLIVAGWWTAFKLGGGIALYLAGAYERMGIDNYWSLVYLTLSVVVVLSNLAMLRLIKPAPARDEQKRKDQQSFDEVYSQQLGRLGLKSAVLNRLLAWLLGAVISPLWSFFRRNGVAVALLLLGFIFLFKVGEAFLGRMSIIFYNDVGFTKEEIATYSKFVGWVATVGFSLLGGLINIRFGLIPSVFISGVAMALTNLLFALMALVGPNTMLFAVAVVADDFTTAVSTVTFVAFISQLCDKTFSATQYALMASIATLGRNTLASFSGVIVDALEARTMESGLSIAGADPSNSAWFIFFIITCLMVIPSLVLLWFIRTKLSAAFASAKTKVL